MKELNYQEQAFVACYMNCFNATQAALQAGYAETVAKNHAWSWVSVTGCPPNKRHVQKTVEEKIAEIYGAEDIDKGWVLKRAKLIADFNIIRFLRINDHGDAVYDFSTATHDDWYCIEEYVTDQTYRRAVKGEEVPVDKIKIKNASKLQALKLLGDHVDVGAFKEQVDITSGGKPIQNDWHIHPTAVKQEASDGES